MQNTTIVPTPSRQERRAVERNLAKKVASASKKELFKERQRELLQRQAQREKSGFYTGLSVAAVLSATKSRKPKRKIVKGRNFGRILYEKNRLAYHATKGWRAA